MNNTAPIHSLAELPLYGSSISDVSGGVELQEISQRPMFGPQLIKFHSTAGGTVSVTRIDGTVLVIPLTAGVTEELRDQVSSVTAAQSTRAVMFWFSTHDPDVNP